MSLIFKVYKILMRMSLLYTCHTSKYVHFVIKCAKINPQKSDQNKAISSCVFFFFLCPANAWSILRWSICSTIFLEGRRPVNKWGMGHAAENQHGYIFLRCMHAPNVRRKLSNTHHIFLQTWTHGDVHILYPLLEGVKGGAANDGFYINGQICF